MTVDATVPALKRKKSKRPVDNAVAIPADDQAETLNEVGEEDPREKKRRRKERKDRRKEEKQEEGTTDAGVTVPLIILLPSHSSGSGWCEERDEKQKAKADGGCHFSA